MSSNFFSQQDLARRNTRILVLLFSLAVLLLLALTNLLAFISFGLLDPSRLNQGLSWQQLPWPLVGTVSLVVIVAVGIAVLVKWQQLQAGGKVVAESLGGVRVLPDSNDAAERRLLNVVEEMALAANTPVPPVYLLPERSINAFAAGYSPADAVIGVTRGCVEQLNRDQLQGVIAHEFSHILNGDMRMNIRLIAILNGILFLGHIGYYLLRGSRGATLRVSSRSSNNKNGAGGIVVLGLGLVVIGYVGSFFGNLIKAAVSRQREFLADASAVQFTRNPRGIAGALKLIGSHSQHSRISNGNADENSHLFFAEAISRWASIFATHPPLAQRIKRLEPHWNGKFPSATDATTAQREATTDAKAGAASGTSYAERLQQALPLLLLHSSRQTEPAMALVCCLLLQQGDAQRSAQLRLIKEMGSAALLQQVDGLCDAVASLSALQQVQLLQRLMPALKALPESRFVVFEQLLQALLQAIPSLTLAPWLVSAFVTHNLAVQYDPTEISKGYLSTGLNQHAAAIAQLLALVSAAAGNAQQQQQAWQAGVAALGFNPADSRPGADFSLLDAQLPVLLALAPQQKARLWQALEATVHADKLLQDDEQALLLALALLLEMPYNAATA
ncbi:M48 family metallopeptidase [Rheinheimera nanhaiensis]|uniref:Heat shock protein HtpX n=1 Tax=Rheinheimera nanhaiensis E407-8 TaxID=562729 RepID=I1DSX4_9GAMM|nr:M48 family metallopeptidase [Rheinheimera nanhaiensis]GAB57152.1 heat shock protein HtpX [Rheinheimera nanhaiensis E407-8]